MDVKGDGRRGRGGGGDETLSCPEQTQLTVAHGTFLTDYCIVHVSGDSSRMLSVEGWCCFATMLSTVGFDTTSDAANFARRESKKVTTPPGSASVRFVQMRPQQASFLLHSYTRDCASSGRRGSFFFSLGRRVHTGMHRKIPPSPVGRAGDTYSITPQYSGGGGEKHY